MMRGARSRRARSRRVPAFGATSGARRRWPVAAGVAAGDPFDAGATALAVGAALHERPRTARCALRLDRRSAVRSFDGVGGGARAERLRRQSARPDAGAHGVSDVGQSCGCIVRFVREASAVVRRTSPNASHHRWRFIQLGRRSNGHGGIWRVPPSFDESRRSPLPRWTALNGRERARIHDCFYEWARLSLRMLHPGVHVFLASRAFLSPIVFAAMIDAGLEVRGKVIRLVRTLCGRVLRRPLGAARVLRAMGRLSQSVPDRRIAARAGRRSV